MIKDNYNKGYTDIRLKNSEFKLKEARLKIFYNYLVSRDYDGKGYSYPSQKTMAEDLGCSVRTIQRYVSLAKEKGLIEVKRMGFNSVNKYTYLKTLVKKVKEKAKELKDNFKKKVNYSNKQKQLAFGEFEQREYSDDFYKMLEEGCSFRS